MTMEVSAAGDEEAGGGGGAVAGAEEEEEEEEDDGSRGCVGPRAWVVAVASLPFLAIGISLSCIGYLATQDKGSEESAGGLERHFRILGPIFLSGCGAVFLVCIACRRPAGGRVGTDSQVEWGGGGGGGGAGGAERGGEGKRPHGGGPHHPSPPHDAALWGSCTSDCHQCTTPPKGAYPHVSRMVPPLLKVIPPTPESPAARKQPPSPRHHHLLILTPLRLKQRT